MAGRHSSTMERLRSRIVILATVAVLLAGAVACSSDPERSAEDFCTAYVEVPEEANGLSEPDDLTLDVLRDRVAAIDDAASQAARRAPEDITATVDAIIEPLHTLRNAMKNVDDRAEAIDALRAYRAASDELDEQQRRLDEWTRRHCGVMAVTTTSAPDTVAPGLTG